MRWLGRTQAQIDALAAQRAQNRQPTGGSNWCSSLGDRDVLLLARKIRKQADAIGNSVYSPGRWRSIAQAISRRASVRWTSPTWVDPVDVFGELL